MQTLVPPATDIRSAPPPARAPSTLHLRLWRLPLAVHAALLFGLLVIVAAWVGPGGSFTSDEGASVLQAQAIGHGHWVVPDPLAKADPGARHYPIELSATGSKGSAPLGKHLFYGVVLALVGRPLGVDGMVGLSILGTVAAALLAAALSREIRPGIERVVLWFVALGTPLLFDGFLVVAQAIAAAAAAGSALLMLRYLGSGDRRYLVGMSCLGALACLLRTEALLWCVGLGAAALLTPRPAVGVQKSRRWLAAAVVLASGLAARAADTLLTRYALGSHQAVIGPTAGAHGVGDQLYAAFVSVFQAEPDSYSVLGAWVVGALAVLAVTARMARRGRASPAGLVIVGTSAVAIWGLRIHSGPSTPLSGLAAAAPVLWAGLWLVDRPLLRNTCARMCAVAGALFAALVLVSQYGNGGGLQWGGRFFAIAVPCLAPLALEGLRAQSARLHPRARAVMAGLLVALTGMVAVGAVETLHAAHWADTDMAAHLQAASELSPAGDGGAPVVVTSEAELPRLEWALFDRMRWQLVPPGDMPAAVQSLRGAGISGFLLATTDPRDEVPALSHSGFHADGMVRVPGLTAWYLVPFRTG